jgi:hypothetical protein
MEGQMTLSRSELINEFRLETELIELGENKHVIVSEIGAEDYIKLWTNPEHQKEDGSVDMSKFSPALVAYAVVDDQSQRIFADSDIPMIARSANRPFMKLAEVARRLNGLAGTETKNSEETAQEDSSSGSVSV